MVSINPESKEINCKIVYYGPGLGGKTTNLMVIHKKVPDKNKSDMVSLATESDRTLFFDYLPLDLGKIKGYQTKFQLYTVPGQVYYNETRKLVLRGVDGIVFVADSQVNMLGESVESFTNLVENLRKTGYDIKDIPLVMQYNKRDMANILPVSELEAKVNSLKAPYYEAAALKGDGVFDTLKAISKAVINKYNSDSSLRLGGGGKFRKKNSAPPEPPVQQSSPDPAPSVPEPKAPPSVASTSSPTVDEGIQSYIKKKKDAGEIAPPLKDSPFETGGSDSPSASFEMDSPAPTESPMTETVSGEPADNPFVDSSPIEDTGAMDDPGIVSFPGESGGSELSPESLAEPANSPFEDLPGPSEASPETSVDSAPEIELESPTGESVQPGSGASDSIAGRMAQAEEDRGEDNPFMDSGSDGEFEYSTDNPGYSGVSPEVEDEDSPYTNIEPFAPFEDDNSPPASSDSKEGGLDFDPYGEGNK